MTVAALLSRHALLHPLPELVGSTPGGDDEPGSDSSYAEQSALNAMVSYQPDAGSVFLSIPQCPVCVACGRRNMPSSFALRKANTPWYHPVNPNATLHEALANRMVLEFPTFIVVPRDHADRYPPPPPAKPHPPTAPQQVQPSKLPPSGESPQHEDPCKRRRLEDSAEGLGAGISTSDNSVVAEINKAEPSLMTVPVPPDLAAAQAAITSSGATGAQQPNLAEQVSLNQQSKLAMPTNLAEPGFARWGGHERVRGRGRGRGGWRGRGRWQPNGGNEGGPLRWPVHANAGEKSQGGSARRWDGSPFGRPRPPFERGGRPSPGTCPPQAFQHLAVGQATPSALPTMPTTPTIIVPNAAIPAPKTAPPTTTLAPAPAAPPAPQPSSDDPLAMAFLATKRHTGKHKS